MADIREARFILKDPLQYRDHEFHCVEDTMQRISNSIVVREVSYENYFVTEWSEWSRCDDLNQTSQVYRSRKKSNDITVVQERYCKCSDIRPLPSPRSVLHMKIRKSLLNMKHFPLVKFFLLCQSSLSFEFQSLLMCLSTYSLYLQNFVAWKDRSWQIDIWKSNKW